MYLICFTDSSVVENHVLYSKKINKVVLRQTQRNPEQFSASPDELFQTVLGSCTSLCVQKARGDDVHQSKNTTPNQGTSAIAQLSAIQPFFLAVQRENLAENPREKVNKVHPICVKPKKHSSPGGETAQTCLAPQSGI